MHHAPGSGPQSWNLTACVPMRQACEEILYVMRLDVGSLVERLETAQSRGPSALAPGQPRQTQFDPEVILRVLSHR